MKKALTTRSTQRNQRRRRIRARIIGTAMRPRLSVHRSLNAMFLQLVDDEAGKTLASVHSKKLVASEAGERKAKVAVAFQLGKNLAEKAKALGVTAAVFDRAGYRYHGRVKAAAEGAREGGLKF